MHKKKRKVYTLDSLVGKTGAQNVHTGVGDEGQVGEDDSYLSEANKDEDIYTADGDAGWTVHEEEENVEIVFIVLKVEVQNFKKWKVVLYG